MRSLPFLTHYDAQIDAMLRMHRFHVLHCDIHPGNIAFTSCLSVGEMLPDSKKPRPPGMLIPTFIDLEWAVSKGTTVGSTREHPPVGYILPIE